LWVLMVPRCRSQARMRLVRLLCCDGGFVFGRGFDDGIMFILVVVFDWGDRGSEESREVREARR
jgi:hypothetical protein